MKLRTSLVTHSHKTPVYQSARRIKQEPNDQGVEKKLLILFSGALLSGDISYCLCALVGARVI